MKEIFTVLKKAFSNLFNLNEDKAEEKEIVESIRSNVSFRGTNLWTLIFAILIASIGLNMNSTAVIIGAMLISPLMGPTMGIGLAIGVYDFDLLKRGIKNILIAASICIITSCVYFLITPPCTRLNLNCWQDMDGFNHLINGAEEVERPYLAIF